MNPSTGGGSCQSPLPVLFYTLAMKKVLLLAAAALSLSPALLTAGDTHTFEGAITGVVCVACKQHVTEALTTSLEGVTEIKITPSEKDGEQKITIVSKKADVTKETAVKALGKLADDYQILSLEKKG